MSPLSVSPDFATFAARAREGHLVAVHADQLGDLFTPVSAALRLRLPNAL